MAYTARTLKAMENRKARRSQQFGQPYDGSVQNGARGCTHTVLQWLAWLWKKKWYTLDQVSRLAGYPYGANRGLRPSEVTRFCKAVGLPYVVNYDRSAQWILDRANAYGPVGFGHSYSYWPERKNYTYGGVHSDGRPNGYASPDGRGRTQLKGFVPPNDAHFGVVLGYDKARPSTSVRCAAWEPNHGSPSRPETPPYDFMTTGQLLHTYESYKKVLGRTLYALVPTKGLPL
jgi:hypothetical protein